MSEQWLPVVGHDGWYDVSDLGNVRSWRTMGPPYGRRLTEPRLMARRLNTSGYVQVGLRLPNDKQRFHLVHCLALKAFVGPRPDGHQGAHLDGDQLNCRLENLVWVTPKVNGTHRVAHGTQARGERNSKSSLTDDAVRAMRATYAAGGVSQRELGLTYGVSKTTVGSIVRCATWRHVA